MAKTAAERQAKFRHEHGRQEGRINTYLSIEAACALRRLARHYGVTKRDLLEKLLVDEQTRLLATMDSDDVSDAYFGVTP
jgi:hypothetical protein